jgi:hypothetical protein
MTWMIQPVGGGDYLFFDYELLERLEPDWDLREVRYAWLSVLDWYGDTILDPSEIRELLPDWQQLRNVLDAREDVQAAEAVEELLTLCLSQGRSIKFLGD